MKRQMETPADGAAAERKAICARITRLLRDIDSAKHLTNPEKSVAMGYMLDLMYWISQRTKRYNARPGGLGRKTFGGKR